MKILCLVFSVAALAAVSRLNSNNLPRANFLEVVFTQNQYISTGSFSKVVLSQGALKQVFVCEADL